MSFFNPGGFVILIYVIASPLSRTQTTTTTDTQHATVSSSGVTHPRPVFLPLEFGSIRSSPHTSHWNPNVPESEEIAVVLDLKPWSSFATSEFGPSYTNRFVPSFEHSVNDV